MGKRKQGSRAAKRAAETYKDFEQALTEQAEQDRIASKPDDELFVIDTERKETSRKNKLVKREQYREKVMNGHGAKKKGKHDPSDKDLRQIQKVLENHGQIGAVDLARRGRAKLEQKRQEKRMAGMSSKGKPTYDLWNEPQPNKKAKLVAVSTGKLAQGGIAPVEILPVANTLPTKTIDPDFDAPIQSSSTLSKKQLKARKHAQAVAKPTLALEIAHPGQSYHPDKEQHQDAIGEALSIEIRRNEAEEYKTAPISNGMSAFTQGFIIRESDSEESSDEEEEDETIVGSGKLIKKRDKLTRAQRNKQKRVKAEQTALLERKQEKQFMHQINEVKKHDKAVKEADRKNLERQKELVQLKEEKRAQPLGKDLWNAVSQKDPIRAPSLPVALTEELERQSGGGSLRTVTPKGSLVTDRLESMVARGMIQKKRVDGRRIVQGKRRKKVVGEKGTEYLLI
jgi:nucleolar protein 53